MLTLLRGCPGDILNISIPTLEALAQFGTATIISKNTGTLEASYSLVSHSVQEITDNEQEAMAMELAAVSIENSVVAGLGFGFLL
ncbi:HAPLESS 2 protein [Nymphaea thermarum]|nr:HAPLESS 2 protein [Nymphaea thermarum]